MVEISVEVQNPTGLHARPAAFLIQAASKFKSQIWLVKDDKEVDAKSILGLITLSAKHGDKLICRAQGEDAQLAVETIAGLINEPLDNLTIN
jgi:phosphocarrier protein